MSAELKSCPFCGSSGNCDVAFPHPSKNPTNWPNPERPGVPMFPERSGRHHVGNNLLFWYSDIQKWVTASPIRGCKEPEDFAGDEYHGPVLTPTQIAELLAGERERCAVKMDQNKQKVVDDCGNYDPATGVTEITSEAANTEIEFYEMASQTIRNLGAAL